MTAIDTSIASAPSISESKTTRPTVVVATDGSEASTAAFTAANLLVETADADIRVTSILEPLPMPVEVAHTVLNFDGLDSERAKDFTSRVRVQVREHEPHPGAWPLETRIGVAAVEIADSAQTHSADLVVVGASHHGLLDRFIGEETAARVAQLGNIPLLVASAGMLRLPRRIAVAMDLDPSQLGDLPPLLSILGSGATITCVHVQRDEEFPGSDLPAFSRAYEKAVAESFDVTQKSIAKVPGLRADLVRLRGDPATELLRYAERAKVELLVLGLRRHYGLRRLLGGGVALKVLRESTCSVLIVPETSGATDRKSAEHTGERGTTLTSYVPAVWPAQLRQFTQKNSGRRASLEVDGTDVGAVIQVAGLPFLGADYDHRDQRVEILLGDFAGSDRHFTRSIPNPDAVSVLRGSDAKDNALCITYAGGQTLLTFT
jgi:nucleotide-binding universal stress UspA family protein